MLFKLKILTLTTILIVLLIALLAYQNWIILNPGGEFKHQVWYQEFNVYSETPIGDELKVILDEVSFRLSQIPGYYQGKYKIFLCSNSETFGKFADIVGKPNRTQGFNLQPLNYIFINASLVEEIRTQNINGYKYNILEGNIAHIIAHEIVHQLIADQLGYFKMRGTDSWKLEGYCEYAASLEMKKMDSLYQFTDFYTDYFSGKYSELPSGKIFYIKSALITEYYLDHKNKLFEDLIKTEEVFDQLLNEMKLFLKPRI